MHLKDSYVDNVDHHTCNSLRIRPLVVVVLVAGTLELEEVVDVLELVDVVGFVVKIASAVHVAVGQFGDQVLSGLADGLRTLVAVEGSEIEPAEHFGAILVQDTKAANKVFLACSVLDMLVVDAGAMAGPVVV